MDGSEIEAGSDVLQFHKMQGSGPDLLYTTLENVQGAMDDILDKQMLYRHYPLNMPISDDFRLKKILGFGVNDEKDTGERQEMVDTHGEPGEHQIYFYQGSDQQIVAATGDGVPELPPAFLRELTDHMEQNGGNYGDLRETIADKWLTGGLNQLFRIDVVPSTMVKVTFLGNDVTTQDTADGVPYPNESAGDVAKRYVTILSAKYPPVPFRMPGTF